MEGIEQEMRKTKRTAKAEGAEAAEGGTVQYFVLYEYCTRSGVSIPTTRASMISCTRTSYDKVPTIS